MGVAGLKVSLVLRILKLNLFAASMEGRSGILTCKAAVVQSGIALRLLEACVVSGLGLRKLLSFCLF